MQSGNNKGIVASDSIDMRRVLRRKIKARTVYTARSNIARGSQDAARAAGSRVVRVDVETAITLP